MSSPALLTWQPRTKEGRRLQDLVEILHEVGFAGPELRQAVTDCLAGLFPRANCTLTRANLEEFIYEVPERSSVVKPEQADNGDGGAAL